MINRINKSSVVFTIVMMKLLFLCSVVFVVVSAHKCKPKYHFWRPYNGTVPRDAFVASVDEDGTKSYVAKIIPMDQYSWTIPVQFKEGWDHVDFSWCCKKNNTMRVDEFIEILCTDESEQLHWRSVHQNVEEIRSHCCPVEGGIGYRNGRKMKAYIGRALRNGVGHVGRVYLKKITQGLHIMTGTNATKIMEDFDILSYDCKEDEVPLPKPE